MDEHSAPRWRSIAVALVIAMLLALLGWVLLVRDRGQPAPEAGPAKVSDPARERPAEKAAVPAREPPPDLAGEVILAGCRQGECAWVRIVRLESVSASPHGELRRLTLRNGASSGDADAPAPTDVQWEAQDRADYVFCSIERPAYAFPGGEGGYIIHYLDLFALAGYEMSSAGLYLRVCHDQPFDPEDNGAIRALGYRPGTRNEQVEHARPEDMAAF
jgi:hypothetical protein